MKNAAQKTQIRTLTPKGFDVFTRYFSKVDAQTGETAKVRKAAPPTEILFDDNYSVPLPVDALVDASQPSGKVEMARRVLDAFGDNFDAYVDDRGVWAWLTLLWSESVIPYSEIEEGYILREMARYDIGDNREANYYVYRHAVYGPTIIFRDWGMLSRSVLADPIHKLGDEIDVFMFRNVATAPVLKAYDLMYFDTTTGKIVDAKADAKKRQAEGLRQGDIHDFVDQVLQIGRTYSISRIDPLKLVDLLPRAEFGNRIDHAMARVKIGDTAPNAPLAKAA